MRIFDIIANKRDGKSLTKAEISFFIDEYINGNVTDYQASALLMAIYINGMNSVETSNLTSAMANSGEIVDLSMIDGIKVDKHSTGGVGDKTTLIISPIVASCGVKVAKMSGRGLGHTGGTIDKLESIPNFKTTLSQEKFIDIVNKINVSIIGQSGNLAPADKKLYSLRDVTATVESIPLIASSIMSKKIASGADCILLDVKTGSGAFMKTLDKSIELANEMVSIGENIGRKTIALITNMDVPLGYAIGNTLEVIESIETLKGNGPPDLTEVCIKSSANMLFLADKGTLTDCENLARNAIKSGEAFDCFKKMVAAQGGDTNVINDTDKFQKSKFSFDVYATKSGYITKMDTEKCGIASVILGAGRRTKDDVIDYSAGVLLNRKYADFVEKGEVVATLFCNDETLFIDAGELLQSAIIIEPSPPKKEKLIFARITQNEIIKY